jgi:hypothetical protein
MGPSSEAPQKAFRDRDGERAFWNPLLFAANGKNDPRMGMISLLDGLQHELRDPGQNNGGLMYIRALPQNGAQPGWNLYGSHIRTTGSEAVYFMPWKSGTTVYADRSWYEDSVCDFFLTTKLSGCRFAITQTQVLHVAANAMGAKDNHEGSDMRTWAEEMLTGIHGRTRRASQSGKSHKEQGAGYGTLGYVFGMRLPDRKWVYKLYSKDTDSWRVLWA